MKNSAKAVIARMVSFCLETGNDTLKFATDNPRNIALYKSLGMKEDGIRYFNGTPNTVLRFDKEDMEMLLIILKQLISRIGYLFILKSDILFEL